MSKMLLNSEEDSLLSPPPPYPTSQRPSSRPSSSKSSVVKPHYPSNQLKKMAFVCHCYRSIITSLDALENTPYMDLKLLYWRMASHFSIFRLMMRQLWSRSREVLNDKNMKDYSISHHVYQFALPLLPDAAMASLIAIRFFLHPPSYLKSSSNLLNPQG